MRAGRGSSPPQRRDLIRSLIDEGFSQADIAREMGITRQAVQKMLACSPAQREIGALAAVLAVTGLLTALTPRPSPLPDSGPLGRAGHLPPVAWAPGWIEDHSTAPASAACGGSIWPAGAPSRQRVRSGALIGPGEPETEIK